MRMHRTGADCIWSGAKRCCGPATRKARKSSSHELRGSISPPPIARDSWQRRIAETAARAEADCLQRARQHAHKFSLPVYAGLGEHARQMRTYGVVAEVQAACSLACIVAS